jgi:hypothetical protein
MTVMDGQAGVAEVSLHRPHDSVSALQSTLFATSPSVLASDTTLALRFMGSLASRLSPCRFSVRAVPRKRGLISRVATTGAIRDVLSSMQKSGG